MKFTFSEQETKYLGTLVTTILELAPRDVEPTVIRTFGKMRWKFAPNSLYVNLTGKERNVLASMLNYRLVQLNYLGNEAELADSLMTKLVQG